MGRPETAAYADWSVMRDHASPTKMTRAWICFLRAIWGEDACSSLLTSLKQCGEVPNVETKRKLNYGGISRNVGVGDASPDSANLVINLWHSRRISARAWKEVRREPNEYSSLKTRTSSCVFGVHCCMTPSGKDKVDNTSWSFWRTTRLTNLSTRSMQRGARNSSGPSVSVRWAKNLY
jgi:hypothetical protein